MILCGWCRIIWGGSTGSIPIGWKYMVVDPIQEGEFHLLDESSVICPDCYQKLVTLISSIRKEETLGL